MSDIHSQIARRFSSRGRQRGFSTTGPLAIIAIIALILTSLMLFFGQKANAQAPQPAQGPAQMAVTTPAAMLDSQLVDAQRQLGLLQSLVEIGSALAQIQPYREMMLILLDQELPVHERWRLALQSQPVHLPQSGQIDPLELDYLRQEIDAIRAEMQLLQNLPNVFQKSQPDPSDDPILVGNEPDGEWEVGRDSVRYVQLDGAGAEPAIWLASNSAGVRVLKNQTIVHRGREIRLNSLQRQADGRVLVNLQVDGVPNSFSW